MIGGAAVGFLLHFSLLLLTAPAKLDAEAKAALSKAENDTKILDEKARHGQNQHLQLNFETEDGCQDTHTYPIVHGRRVLNRIDPP